MPELPEVETMRRGILWTIGSRIRNVIRPRSRYRPLPMTPAFDALKKQLIGTTVSDVQRLGKRVVVCLDTQMYLVFQPKMAGLVLVGEPPTVEHVRVRFEMDSELHPEFLYWDKRGLGSIHLWDQASLNEHLGPHILGPDALAVDWEEMKQQFCSSDRPIKPTLLDQKRLAGIGNLYASEILHRAKIHPAQPCSSLSNSEWKRVHEASIAILETAIAYEGSTLSDGSYRNAQSDPGSYQNQHRVYDRADLPCLRCRSSTIVRIVQSQRSTFFCPRCQPLR